jgi:Domain of unknown function (DUF4917)
VVGSDLDLDALGLADWADLKSEDWDGILVGNGASRALADSFAYSSLLDVAQEAGLLDDISARLFEFFDTTNFEQVLEALRAATLVCDALEMDWQAVLSRYESVAKALAGAVHTAHVEWSDVGEDRLDLLHEAILPYGWVFSTNYDLLLYWAAMRETTWIRDYFFNQELVFNRFDVSVPYNATRVLFLHGGLHLWRLKNGQTLKRRREETESLLELVSSPPAAHEGATPLIITEGTSDDKLAAIYRSDYLAFAFEQFQGLSGPLVVFGLSFGESDGHLIGALRESGARQLAVSMRAAGATPDTVEARAKELEGHFPKADLVLYAAETHPLGNPALRI